MVDLIKKNFSMFLKMFKFLQLSRIKVLLLIRYMMYKVVDRYVIFFYKVLTVEAVDNFSSLYVQLCSLLCIIDIKLL